MKKHQLVPFSSALLKFRLDRFVIEYVLSGPWLENDATVSFRSRKSFVDQ